MQRALGRTEVVMTQQVVLHRSVSAPPSGRRDSLSGIARLCSVAGLALCAVSVLGWLLTRASGGAEVPAWLLWSGYWWFLALASLLGVWLAVAGIVLGIAYTLVEKRRGRCAPWAPFITLVGLIALAATSCSLVLAHQPAYFLAAGLPASHSRLDALNARDTARAYLTSQNLSVQYWLSDADGRDFWRASDAVPDLSLLAGASDVRITPLHGASEPNDATHRSFSVSYVSHAANGVGEPPGPQVETMNLVRMPGGPWRVSYLGLGI
jgi:hypothetical protein